MAPYTLYTVIVYSPERLVIVSPVPPRGRGQSKSDYGRFLKLVDQYGGGCYNLRAALELARRESARTKFPIMRLQRPIGPWFWDESTRRGPRPNPFTSLKPRARFRCECGAGSGDYTLTECDHPIRGQGGLGTCPRPARYRWSPILTDWADTSRSPVGKFARYLCEPCMIEHMEQYGPG